MSQIANESDDLLVASRGVLMWWMSTPAYQSGEDEMPPHLFRSLWCAVAKADGIAPSAYLPENRKHQTSYLEEYP